VEFDEQLSELSRPVLPGELTDAGEFPQVVGVAESVAGLVVLPIDDQTVVDSYSGAPVKLGRTPQDEQLQRQTGPAPELAHPSHPNRKHRPHPQPTQSYRYWA